MRLSDVEFRAAFHNFARSTFRLEALQVYTVETEQPKLARFLAGEDKPVEPESEWRKMIRTGIEEGRTWRKVKLIRRPLTDYQRYSLAWGIPPNAQAGLEHRILDITERDFDLPEIDFWLFDDSKVIVIHYHDDGSPDWVELVESPDIEQYRRWRDIALKESVPFGEYRA